MHPPPRAGRILTVVGIALVALNLRTALGVFSPIIDVVGRDIPLDAISIGGLGMLPPISFALFGLSAPSIARRVGLERTVIAGMLAITAGYLVRATSDSVAGFAAGTMLTLAGIGVGNVLLPPLVKTYFPDRIGPVTALTTVLMSVSAGVPPLVAPPIAAIADWRLAIGIWGVLSLSTIGPWLFILLKSRGGARRDDSLPVATNAPPGRVWRSPVAWSLVVIMSVASFNAYAMFAWLPALLVDTTEQSAFSAGALLAVYGFMGLPAALAVPLLAVRLRNVGVLVQVGVVFFVTGYLGLILAPAAAPLLWVVLAGLGPLLFPLVFVLINLRTRTYAGTVALSGFAQGTGYLVGASGPVLFGIVHDLSGGWTAPLTMLFGMVAVGSAVGFMLRTPRMLEDTWLWPPSR